MSFQVLFTKMQRSVTIYFTYNNNNNNNNNNKKKKKKKKTRFYNNQ